MREKLKGGIYRITINGKYYIGQTISFVNRKKFHGNSKYTRM